MMKRTLEYSFLGIVLFFGAVLAYNIYKDKEFQREFPKRYYRQIEQKEQEILRNMQRAFGFSKRFEVIVSDKLPGRIYGLATRNARGEVVILLNKKAFKESSKYMLEDVLAHEYAHALLLYRGVDDASNGGHTPLWQRSCKKLGGSHCERYVDREEVINEKLKKLLGG